MSNIPSLPPSNRAGAPPDSAVQGQLDAIFGRVGLARSDEGALHVKGAPGVNRPEADFANRQVRATQETLLKPPSPPKVALTGTLTLGAAAFAANVSQALESLLVRPEGLPLSPNAGPRVRRSGLDSQQDSRRSLWTMLADVNGSEAARGLREHLATTDNVPAADGLVFRHLYELTADALLAAFLKLNITDPNNSTETHQKLHEVMSELRQRAIADAKQKMKVAEELRLEAEKEAEQAAYISGLMSMIRIALIVVAAIAMFIPGVNLAVLAIVVAVVVLITSVMEAKANNEAAEASTDAAQATNFGKRAQLMADRAQEQLQEEAEIIKTIVESKNKMVDAVIRMVNATFGAAQKLMSAGMAKG